jgi:7,8-dihydropterin-6-yl-methyl-4-(beta-D-ribofuranosyl)aminobenzene 5'-phosphate synthase
MTDYPGRFEIIRENTEILPGVFIFPHIVGNRPKPLGNRHLFLKRGSTLIPDDFTHEIVMAIKENGKLIVFTGCSHNGILNMADTVAAVFKGVPIKAVIGGFHLIGVPPLNFMAGTKSEVEGIARSILDYPIETTYTGHCTCARAFKILKSVMRERIVDISTGSCFEI